LLGPEGAQPWIPVLGVARRRFPVPDQKKIDRCHRCPFPLA